MRAARHSILALVAAPAAALAACVGVAGPAPVGAAEVGTSLQAVGFGETAPAAAARAA